jgi:lipopolysaccharide export LptBFGC system permease protein LptF
VPTAREWAAADEHAVGRTLAFALGFIALATLLFDSLPLSFVLERDHLRRYANATLTGRDVGMLTLYLLPQALAASIPLGFGCGVLFGLRGRTPVPRVRRAVLWMAMLCSLLVLIAVAWVTPDSNQAFRELAFGGRLVRGTNERSLRELWTAGHWLDVHVRLAVACAPMVLGLFAWSVSARKRTRWFVLGLAGTAAYAAQFVAEPAPVMVLAQSLPAIVAAWTPNALVAAAAATILRLSRPQKLSSVDSQVPGFLDS